MIARAHAVAPHLSVDVDLAEQICERLDRLPLAIELAAARTKTLAPGEILQRLQRRLPVLSTGPRDAPRRQRTLQATLDWSYQLLTDHEQTLFARVAAFAGGFTLPAAETVCDADLGAVQALTARSSSESTTAATGCCRHSAITRSDGLSKAARWVRCDSVTPGGSSTSSRRRRSTYTRPARHERHSPRAR